MAAAPWRNRVIQEEADGRKLIIHLYDNGTPLDLTGKTVSIYYRSRTIP